MKHTISLILLLAAVCLPAKAQITLLGSDPDSLKWRIRKTEHFNIIYPEILRMEDVGYCTASLEGFRESVGRSLGMMPGQYQLRKTPLVLHPANIYSNGSVLMAPERMDFYTTPDPYDSDPMPWLKLLSIHESRHLAQLQAGFRGVFRWGYFVLGELVPGAFAGVYPGLALMEGDAVVAETALTKAGRGRTADFLNYMQVAFSEGDWRNFYRWRYGSFKRYTPDYYKVGYLTVAGARTLYDDPLFTARYFDNVVRRPLRTRHFQRTLKQASGKNLRKSFREIEQYFNDIWEDEAAGRAPFTPSEKVSGEKPRFPVNYRGNVAAEGWLYTVKSSYTLSPRLVRINPETGEEADLGPFASTTSTLRYDSSLRRIWWSESRGDIRWELGGTSVICWLDLEDLSRHTLTEGSRYFNPVPCGDKLVVLEYPVGGGTTPVLLDPRTGEECCRLPLSGEQEGVQLTETAFLDGRIYALGLDDEGFAIWRNDGTWSRVSDHSLSKIRQLTPDGGRLRFVSDRDGSNEFYSFDPVTGECLQLTSLRFGGSDFAALGDKIYYSATTSDGKELFSLPADSLSCRPVSIADVHSYPVADKLSAQEASLAGQGAGSPAVAEFSQDKPYRKAGHLLKIHSWAPFYFEYDEIMALSGDAEADYAGLGATLMMQNDLGTSYGSAGYNLGYDGGWKHSGQLKYIYSGWWPVLEADLNIGGRERSMTGWRDMGLHGERYAVTSSNPEGGTFMSARFRAYVPLNFSKGGVLEGLIPELSYGISNNLFNRSVVRKEYSGALDGSAGFSAFTGAEEGTLVPLQSLKLSVRGYRMLPTARSQVYPSLGIGAEAGWSSMPGIGRFFSDNVYLYAYGYLPGLLEEQGLRLSFRSEISTGFGSAVGRRSISCVPRGAEGGADDYLAGRYATRGRLTADYAIPFYIGDISFLSPLIYVRNFVLTPHFDLSFAGNMRDYDWTGHGEGAAKGFKLPLWCAGFDFTASVANFVWAPFDGRVGFRVDWNGGPLFNTLKDADLVSRTSVSMIFNMDI